ncbi:MAG: hypothetical protein B6I20_11365 [Bacteroidetes bacterium 4572_117]|nr:MAG: hypothetical protein B6I20_11365 [Bacteroidetes bacterium 4572_117]
MKTEGRSLVTSDFGLLTSLPNNIINLVTLTKQLCFGDALFGQSYEIKLHINGAENQKAKLAYYLGDKQYVEQTASFNKKGKLIFKGDKQLPTGIYMVILDNGYFDFLVDKEQNFSMSSDTSNFIANMKISGSDENKLFFEYQVEVIGLKARFEKIEKKIKLLDKKSDSLKLLKTQKQNIEDSVGNLWKKIVNNAPNSYLAKVLSAFNSRNINNFNLADPEMLRTPVYTNMLRLFIKKNINKITPHIIFETRKLLDSLKPVEANYEYVANYLLNFYNTFYKIGMNEVFVFIADNYFLPEKASWFNKEQLSAINKRRNVLAQSLVGEIAPKLVLEGSNGEFFSLHQIDAKFTILYFWSSNCGHCTIATKALKNAYAKLQKKNIEVFAVNIDTDSTKWLKYIEDFDLQWINCQDINAISGFREKYYVYGSPLLFLLDNKKIILSKQNGEVEIQKLIEKLVD